MAALKFDMSDPETKATVQGWENGAEYVVTMVDSAAGTASYEEEPVEEEAAAAPAPAPGPAAVAKAMGG
jgi:hypothetical protein